MIRDLEYPKDARKVYDALLKGLEYDAAFAVLGNVVKLLPPLGDQPDFSTGIRFGSKEADQAVRGDAPGLFSRFALLSMITRIEEFNRLLLLQRYVIEELKSPKRRMTGQMLWPIVKLVAKNIKHKSATEVVTMLLVPKPSAELIKRAGWLDGLVKVRNCLAHRHGIVQMDDVKKHGTSIEQTKDTDRLEAQWIGAKAYVGKKEIKSFPYKSAGQARVDVRFRDYKKSWKIGEVIDITPLECQGMAQSLALLGGRILSEFEAEMNALLGVDSGSTN